jgi:hypothetical protein
MRNILEYPITKEEVETVFVDAFNDHNGEVGGHQQMVIQDLLDNFDEIWEKYYKDKFGYANQ